MKVIRIYTGSDNQSHFEDVLVPMKDAGKIGFMSEITKATGVVFRDTCAQKVSKRLTQAILNSNHLPEKTEVASPLPISRHSGEGVEACFYSSPVTL